MRIIIATSCYIFVVLTNISFSDQNGVVVVTVIIISLCVKKVKKNWWHAKKRVAILVLQD